MNQTPANDDLIRWSALSEPGDRLATAIYRERPDLVSGDLTRLMSPGALYKELQADCFAGYLHSLPALVERIKARLPLLDVSAMRAAGQRFGATPISAVSLPEGLRKNFARLGDSQPLLLWLVGNVQALEASPRIAFIGTRIPTAYSQRIINKAVASFSKVFSVISGGAVGVDSTAHRAALDAQLPTVAFLAGGADRLYPDSNSALFAEIARSGGALVTEVPPGTAPTRWRFLQRNRLIAAASDLLVVTEAGARSGARNTVSHANECGVRVMIAPGSIESEASKGANLMLAEQLGEPLLQPQCLESAFLSGNMAGYDVDAEDSQAEPSSEAKRVLDAFSSGATLFDIARECGLETRAVSNQLELLATRGLVARDGIHWVRLKPPGSSRA